MRVRRNRGPHTRVGLLRGLGSMAAPGQKLDRPQVKKAVQALLAYTKTKDKTDELLLNENENVYLMVTVWKIPPQEQVIKIPLPHGIRPETSEVCLFTKDEPELSGEQTENLYRKLLIQNGITSISQIISYKTLKKEYKPFEAKRRLLNRFDLFLADDRIRRLLPSHIGKHFYQSKKAPLSVNLKAKNLAKELNKHIQGTILPVTNKGCCYTARVGHTGMKADELLENVSVAAEVISNKLPKNWKNIKVLHLKTLKSVALPIFNSYICNLDELDKQPSLHQKGGQKKKGKKRKQKAVTEQTSPKAKVTAEKKKNATTKNLEKEQKRKAETLAVTEPDEDDGEIPQLVPIQTEASIAGQEKTEPNQTPGKGVNMSRKPETPRGKRKMTSLAPETPKTKLKLAENEEDLPIPAQQKQPKKPRSPKEAVKEKELKKTPKKPAAKSFDTPHGGKLVKSAKKALKTPKQMPKKKKVPQSA
ncbi:ribosomal L1 domain-containing protein 1 [Terrapene carolina triunguis]|uniref:Ribosomal L1 domain containing 1 n=1 Tax=Terrapene triunguis TaxID=2587831 RepID=A0A674KD18_9SAUR|nr:ribosomal L1 domain-containing protein 1 [Terrapene carolina triunguis]